MREVRNKPSVYDGAAFANYARESDQENFEAVTEFYRTFYKRLPNDFPNYPQTTYLCLFITIMREPRTILSRRSPDNNSLAAELVSTPACQFSALVSRGASMAVRGVTTSFGLC